MRKLAEIAPKDLDALLGHATAMLGDLFAAVDLEGDFVLIVHQEPGKRAGVLRVVSNCSPPQITRALASARGRLDASGPQPSSPSEPGPPR